MLPHVNERAFYNCVCRVVSYDSNNNNATRHYRNVVLSRTKAGTQGVHLLECVIVQVNERGGTVVLQTRENSVAICSYPKRSLCLFFADGKL